MVVQHRDRAQPHEPAASTRAHPPAGDVLLPSPDVAVCSPKDAARAHFLDTLAAYLSSDGGEFEAALAAREWGNNEFEVLWQRGSSDERSYVAWRVFSISNGDTLRHWRTQPFRMLADGALWSPPTVLASSTGELQHGMLADVEAEQWESILSQLTLERASVRNAMVWAFDHSDAVNDVIRRAAAAMCRKEAQPAERVSVLFLLSDVLHNAQAASATRGVAAFRSVVALCLPECLAALRDALDSADSRIAVQGARARVAAVLRAWENWFVFTNEFLHGLSCTFTPPPADALPEDPELRTTLEKLPFGELHMRCRQRGVPSAADSAACIYSLLQHALFVRLQRGEKPVEARAAALPQLSEVKSDERGSWHFLESDKSSEKM